LPVFVLRRFRDAALVPCQAWIEGLEDYQPFALTLSTTVVKRLLNLIFSVNPYFRLSVVSVFRTI
jgi:hypothetical protein